MSFESPIGTYKEKTKEITLSGGSKIATKDDIFVSAEEISWVGSKDKIVAHGNVKIIKSNELVTISDASEFDTGFTNLKITGNSKTMLYEIKRK